MEMRLFTRALVRWWFLPIVMLVIALAGVMIYHRIKDTKEAAATVAVMQSYFPPPGEYVPPQIGFDALAGSQDLHARIANSLHDGTTAAQIGGKLSISYQAKLNQPNPSPLYKVSVSDKDQARAIKIDNIAVQEAKKLYGEINTPDAQDVQTAFQSEIDAAQKKVDDARTALTQFEQSNDAYALTQRRDQELSLLSQLRGSAITASGRGATTPGGDGAALTAARSQLNQLTALAPQYERVTSDLTLAGAARDRLTQRVSDLQIAGPGAATQLADAKSQLATAEDSYNQALIAFGNFQTANGVSDLPAAIQSQVGMVNQLTVSDVSTQAGAGAINAAITREQGELERLLSLEPQYDQLNLDLTTAEGQRASLSQHVLDVAVGQSLPASVQVRVMQDAAIQSNLVMTLLTYALAVFLAVFVSLTAVYLLAYFEKMPASVEDIERVFGKPVIGRIPTATT
jgi:capsule polysaccharide export protein KpsE/RkpR